MEKFRGELYAVTRRELEKFEESAFSCGWSICVMPISNNEFRVLFYEMEKSEKGKEQ